MATESEDQEEGIQEWERFPWGKSWREGSSRNWYHQTIYELTPVLIPELCMQGSDPNQHWEVIYRMDHCPSPRLVTGCYMGQTQVAQQRFWKLNWLWNHSQQRQGRNLQPKSKPLNCLLKQMPKQTLSVGFKQDLESYNIIFKMSRIKFRIIQHIMNQENHEISQEKSTQHLQTQMLKVDRLLNS